MQHEPQIVIDLLELSRMQDSDEILHMMEDFSLDGRGQVAPTPWDELGESDFSGHCTRLSILSELKSIFSAPEQEPYEKPAPLWYDI